MEPLIECNCYKLKGKCLPTTPGSIRQTTFLRSCMLICCRVSLAQYAVGASVGAAAGFAGGPAAAGALGLTTAGTAASGTMGLASMFGSVASSLATSFSALSAGEYLYFHWCSLKAELP